MNLPFTHESVQSILEIDLMKPEHHKQADSLLSPLWQDVFPAGLLSELHANPFLAACRNGSADADQLRDFLVQHQYYSQYFTRYLCALMGNITDIEEFKALAENLSEELSGGDTHHISHAQLYRQSMDAMAAVPGSRPILASTQKLIDTMFRYCRSADPLDGLAAMCLGAEAIVPIIYNPILAAMDYLGASDAARLFFRIHVEEDEEHAIVMRRIIDRMVAERPHCSARVVEIGQDMVRARMGMLDDLASFASASRDPDAVTSTMPAGALATLRADASLGSGNFFDRCLALNKGVDVKFIHLERPFCHADNDPVQSFSLSGLQRYRRALAHWYIGQGVRRGDAVAVCVEDGIAPFLHYLALTSLGAAIALINPGMPAEAGLSYMRDNEFEQLFTDAQTLASSEFVQQWNMKHDGAALIDVTTARLNADVQMPAEWPAKPDDMTLVMLSHTSGTTGVPKAVKFEHRQFFMGKRARIGQFTEGPGERLLTALPQSHSAAISHLETAVIHGIPTLVMSSQNGPAVRAAIRAFAPTTVVAFPISYTQLVKDGVAAGEFASVRRWFSMGDAAHQMHIRRLLLGAPASRFIDAFGSSELGMALFRSESTIDAVAPRRSIGRPVDIAVAKIIDPSSGQEVKTGEVGLLAVRAPTVTPGYWRNPERTTNAWHDGYFLTGDVACCKDGIYYQIDREVDVVPTTSGPLYTLMLEEVAQQVQGVCDAAIVGVEQHGADDPLLLAVVLPELGAEESAAVTAAHVSDALHEAANASGRSIGPNDISVAIVRSMSFLPLGATGKVVKQRLRSMAPIILKRMPAYAALLSDVLHVEHGVTKAETKFFNKYND
jgi:acyl-coenzyme A synthetase/AMP-(fatty) acid ligase/pyrroloquinoline quinone (PQQ) biosynthesis protein C